MEQLVFSDEMKRMDEATSTQYGIDSFTLMERAALETAHFILDTFTKGRVGILCGTGNNGGDGLALGRILWEFGLEPQIYLIGEIERASDLTKRQLAILEKHGLKVFHLLPEKDDFDLLVDALFGIGLNREVSGLFANAVAFMNASKAKKLAIDIPSGIHADSGEVLGTATKCDYTITFGAKKVGQILYPGASYCGELICASIGIVPGLFPDTGKFIFDKADLILPDRKADANKGTYGKALVIAGSKNMPGAACLATTAALRSGCGMVRLFTELSNKDSILQSIPEVMLSCYEKEDNPLSDNEKALLMEAISWCDVIAMGPGMGKSKKAYAICELVLEKASKPLIMDADACNLIAANEALETAVEKYDNSVIFTPHIGEFARLMHLGVDDIKKEWIHNCVCFAKKNHCILVCKDARTLVTNGEQVYFNVSGNDGMATAGAGDVLTGILTGLLAQKQEAFAMSCLATYMHGVAGDIAKQNTSVYYMIAQDLIHALSKII